MITQIWRVETTNERYSYKFSEYNLGAMSKGCRRGILCKNLMTNEHWLLDMTHLKELDSETFEIACECWIKSKHGKTLIKAERKRNK